MRIFGEIFDYFGDTGEAGIASVFETSEKFLTGVVDTNKWRFYCVNDTVRNSSNSVINTGKGNLTGVSDTGDVNDTTKFWLCQCQWQNPSDLELSDSDSEPIWYRKPSDIEPICFWTHPIENPSYRTYQMPNLPDVEPIRCRTNQILNSSDT